MSCDDGWLLTMFLVFVSVKVSVLGGDVFWWVIFRGFVRWSWCAVYMRHHLYLVCPYLTSCKDDV